MTGQIQAADFLFLLEQLLMAVLRQLLYFIVILGSTALCFPAHHREQIQLSIQIAPSVGLNALQNALYGLHMAVAVVAQMIECAGLDEALHCPAVQFIAMHPLAEIVKAGVRLILPPLHHILDQVAAHIFDRIQAKADLTASIRRKAAVGNIHIRRQHLDAKAGTLAGIFNDLIRVIQHTGQQSRHELTGIMALEVGRLECHIGIAGRMALIERI